MAASGTLTIYLKSIDYTGALPSGTCYNAGNAGSFGRGRAYLNATINWSINNLNQLSFSYGGATGVTSWYVCSVNGYHIDVQFSTDQSSWTTIATAFTNDYQTCSPSRRANQMIQDLVGQLGTVTLSQSGYIRVYTWTQNACPTSDLPNAYPTQYGSQAVAVPIYIEADWQGSIIYNANGGTNAPASTTGRTAEQSLTLTVTNSTPTWTLHRFEGWSSSATGSVQYSAGDTITVLKASPNKTIYAVWTEYYRPGKVLNANSAWMSHQRSGGAEKVYNGSAWNQMDTIDGGTGTGNPPTIKHSSGWKNQRRIGTE